ncbi:MAG: putative phosphohydrolase, partial [Armatimonadetes bacterium]|nr:putative phosphohydrolase [Armatimonadota bacterium]
LGTALCVGAALLAGLHFIGFPTMRFAAQVLFGELPVLLALVGALHLRSGPTGRPPRGRGALLLAGSLLLVAVYADAYHRCPYDLQVRHYWVDLTRGRPESGTLRLVHLTDLQTHAIREHERRALRQAAALNPDLVILTGDYIQSRYRPTRKQAGADLNCFLRELRLQPRYGVYAVPGDVEHEEWKELFTGTGVTCLENQEVRISLNAGRRLALTGLDLAKSRASTPGELAPLLTSGSEPDIRFLFGHSPDYVRALRPGDRVDLTLAGHTHGGQIVIPPFGPVMTLSRLPRKYSGGLRNYDGFALHVSRGIGMERGLAPQVRFFCPPEISLLEVRY